MNKNKKKFDKPNTMSYNGINATDDTVISDLFSDYFQSTFANSDQNSYNLSSASKKLLVFNTITPEQLDAAFKKLKVPTTAGPDGIPSYFVNNCCSTLRYPLCVSLFNDSLSSDIFPKLWKSSYIQPVHPGTSILSHRTLFAYRS